METSREPSRIEALVARVTLSSLAAAGILAAVALLFLRAHGSTAATISRLAIPLSVVAVALPALVLARRGRIRLAVLLVLGALYCTVLAYALLGGYGLHTYSLPILALPIVVISLLIGPRAGLWATALVLATVTALYALERSGRGVDLDAVRGIPASNILVAYCLLFGTLATVLHRFSRVFRDTLDSTGEQERRLRQLLDVAPMGYVLHRDGRVLIANRTLTAFVGAAAPDPILGADVYALLPEDQRERARAGVDAAAEAEGRSVRGEHQLRDRQGRERIVETLTSRVRLADGPAVVTVFRDVTKERAAIAALAVARDEAESASRAKSQFLANVSHEIRTPMNAVLGLTELMLGAELPPPQRERAVAIRGSARALLRVIDDILDVSRIEAGRVELVESRFSPRALVEEVHLLLKPLADEKALAFVREVGAGVPARVLGDEGRLRQVLINLAANAIKFTAQGEVRLELEATEALGVAASGKSRLSFRVRDTGPGLSSEDIARLFAPFVQLDPSSTRRYGGVGLGLYIAREFAQLMGGRLEVASEPERGSCFELVLELPCEAAPQAEVVPPATERTGGRTEPRSVLLVEDNEVNRRVASAMLESAHHRVVLAGDGAEAVALCARESFDCVLMDCQMPVMDGMEATRRIRARELESGRRRTPIVALTATGMASDRERCLAAGMDGFLAKPFDIEALLRAVDGDFVDPLGKDGG